MIMNICPSKDLNSEQYHYYLKYASLEELETDTITERTFYNFVDHFSPMSNPGPAYDYEEDLNSGFLYTTDNL